MGIERSEVYPIHRSSSPPRKLESQWSEGHKPQDKGKEDSTTLKWKIFQMRKLSRYGGQALLTGKERKEDYLQRKGGKGNLWPLFQQ